ncbi:MAG: hypothetical protein ABII76_00440 [Pseudomonadota bacterium]
MDVALLEELIELQEKRRALEEEVKYLRAREAEASAQLVDEFAAAGVQSMNVNGKTCYLHRQEYASLSGVMPDALREEGLADLLSVNSQRLSAFVREHGADSFREMHPSLAEALRVEERVSIRIRRS